MPPAYRVSPLPSRLNTVLFAAGFQAVRVSSAPKAAKRLRACAAPFQQVLAAVVQTVVNWPPAYTVLPLTVRALTVLLAPGFQGVAAPVVASTAASPLRGRLPLIAEAPVN